MDFKNANFFPFKSIKPMIIIEISDSLMRFIRYQENDGCDTIYHFNSFSLRKVWFRSVWFCVVMTPLQLVKIGVLSLNWLII